MAKELFKVVFDVFAELPYTLFMILGVLVIVAIIGLIAILFINVARILLAVDFAFLCYLVYESIVYKSISIETVILFILLAVVFIFLLLVINEHEDNACITLAGTCLQSLLLGMLYIAGICSVFGILLLIAGAYVSEKNDRYRWHKF